MADPSLSIAKGHDRGQARLSNRLCLIARLLSGSGGLFLLGFGIGMNRQWADRHMLPDILVANSWLTMVWLIERSILILAGALLVVLTQRIGRMVKAGRGETLMRWIGIILAMLFAVPASEGLIQVAGGHGGQPWSRTNEPLRQDDPVIGWTNIPARSAVDPDYPSRPVYALDRNGYRVAAAGRTVDTSAPSILFVGESIMFGKGLNWRDSMAGRIEAQSGFQSANLAVSSFALAQDLLLLRRELPKFRHPLAVVILFGPDLMARDLDRGRPWIDREDRWHGATWSWHLSHLERVLFPYHRPSAIAETVVTDHLILMRAVAIAHQRGAQTLVVVPVFQPEQPQERALRKAIFDGAGIAYVAVPLDPAWRLFPDFHPDARANAAMSRTVWRALRKRLADGP